MDKDILAALAALERVHHDEQRCLNLRSAVLAEHRTNHVEVDPRFCAEVCRLAAEDW